MTSRIRTALLSTAVASGLLLSNAPAYAAPLVEESATQGSGVDVAVGAQDEDEVSAPQEPTVSAIDPQAPAKEPAQLVVAVPTDDAAIPDEPSIAPEEESIPVADEGEMPSGDDEASTEAPQTPAASEEAAGESTGEVSAESTGTGAAQESSVVEVPADGATGAAETIAPESAEGVAVETSQSAAESESETAETATEVVSESASETDTETSDSFEELLDGIEMPAGSESWSEEQWNEFMQTAEGQEFTETVMDALAETEEFNVIIDIVVDFLDTKDSGYLDELKDYLLELFGGNAEWAMEAYNGIAAELRLEGFDVDDWTTDQAPAESAPPVAPSEKPKPEVKPSVKPEIKPAGNVKPIVDKKPIVGAVVKPVVKPAVQAKAEQLAETGSEGALLMGGAGALLVIGGVFALRLRRKSRAH